MTIITKPVSGEKKGDKLVVPLVEDDKTATAPPLQDVEGQNPDYVILRARARRISASTFLCLLLASFMVVGIGIFGGRYLYRQYISAQMNRIHVAYNTQKSNDFLDNNNDNNIRRLHTQIPLSTDNDYQQEKLIGDLNDMFRMFSESSDENDHDDDDDDNNNNNNNNNVNDKKSKDNFDDIIQNYFHEDFEIDVENGNYEKIEVPDFRDGRSGRFIHDFNTNITGIIDISGNRCFVMPLNRGNVLPPKSLFDLISKMWQGYYKVDTRIVRQTMRVITPPIKDLKTIGNYIAKECEGHPIYKLEKYVGGVVKRSTDQHTVAKFAQFSGNKITEFSIVNFDELDEFEKENH